MNRLKRLIHEIHRRSLWQVLGIYVLGGWLALQIVDTLTGALQLPGWFPAFALVLLIIGLPIVLATAFVQEGGPAGGRASGTVESEDLPEGEGATPAAPGGADAPAADPGDGAFHHIFTWRNAIGGGILALALWGVVAAAWLLFSGGLRTGAKAGAAEGADRPGVAVLPFANRSELESDAFFTDGMHDELLTQLTKISGIRVISRTSVMGYRGTEKNVRVIGEELGVDYLLEGGLLRAGDHVRLNVQLVHAPRDEHVWAETYDRAMTVVNLLAIQTEIVQNVVRSLQAVLSPQEEALIAEAPTENVEAYEFYVRGEDWLNRGGLSEEEYSIAAQMYERAIELDPDFAVAYGKLAGAHARLYFQGHDRSPERLARAQAAAERAMALAPDHPEVREGVGDYFYYGLRDYDRALEEYRAALERLPNSATLIARVAWIQRRKGRWEESLAGLERVREMDPRSASVLLNHAVSLQVMRRYEEAEATFDEAVALNPDIAILWALRAMNHVLWRGDLEGAMASWEGAPKSVLENPRTEGWILGLEFLARDYTGMLRRLERTEEEAFDAQWEWVPVTQLRAMAYEGLGDSVRARAAYDSARVTLERVAAERPEDERVWSALGLALVGLGAKEEAITAGKRGAEILPVSRDALWGPNQTLDLAVIYARVGEADAAIDLLEELLRIPAPVSVPYLGLHPSFDPLREHPRFRALVGG